MHNDVRAEIERVLQIRRHRAVVDAEQCSVSMCKLRERTNINNAEQRIRRGLDVQQPRLRCDVRGETLEVASIGIANIHPGTVEYLREQSIASAVKIIAREDFLSGRKQPRNGADGGESAGKAKRTIGVLKLRELLFENRARGVAAARVIVAAELVGLFLLEGRGLVDRRRERLKWILGTGVECD